MQCFVLTFVLLSGVSGFVVPADDNNAILTVGQNSPPRCEMYKANCIEEARAVAEAKGINPDSYIKKECYGEQICPVGEACYVVWNVVRNATETDHKHSSGENVIHMGCWEDSMNACPERECVNTDPDPNGKAGHRFCCCTGDRCNAAFRWLPRQPSSTMAPAQHDKADDNSSSNALIYTVYGMMVVVLIVGLGLFGFCYRRRKTSRSNSMASINADVPETPSTPNLGSRPIQLLEIKAKGRFGSVYKGQLGDRTVAVKVFSLQNKQSWLTEYEIYKLPKMDHENILQYIAREKHGENLDLEFWLITAFHERGSLCDYLKTNTLTWADLCKIAKSMVRGLAHLHDEIIDPRTGETKKPCIAHQDFKSKNILLKSDLTACIADFGLAHVLRPDIPTGDAQHPQVGTRRYMAPEVLEGAINYQREAFLRIDMYACGLVLWELASRCTVAGLTPDEHKLPYEDVLADELVDHVVTRKCRPEFRSTWPKIGDTKAWQSLHPGMATLCQTICDCWDWDAEARLSASCVMERIYGQIEGTLPTTNSLAFNNELNQRNTESIPLLETRLITPREDTIA